MERLRIDDRVYHMGRREYGVYAGPTADPGTVWVRFGSEPEPVKVSAGQLSAIGPDGGLA